MNELGNDLERLIALSKEVAEPSEKAVHLCKWIIGILFLMLAFSIAVNCYLFVNGPEITMTANDNAKSTIAQSNK